MRFREFVVEKAMNFRTFSDVGKRLGTTAKIGFEFEMIVPSDSKLHGGDVEDSRDTQVISYFDSLDEFYDYFDMSRVKYNRIESDYDDWVASGRKDYVDDYWDKFTNPDTEDDDDREKDAREMAEDAFDPDDEHNFKDWIKSEFGDNYSFTQHYDLEPKYGWYSENGRHASVYTEEKVDADAFMPTANEVEYSLDKVVNGSVAVNSAYHATKKKADFWYIEPDSSIMSDDGNDVGVEIVSPPMMLNDALKGLDAVFKWMGNNGLITNSTTGLHINISLPELKTRLDPVKLVLFMGENHVARMFDRIGNTYTKPQIDQIFLKVKMNGRLPASAAEMQGTAEEYLSHNKFHTVNFGHMADGYLEFRVAGGAGYEFKAEEIKKTIYRFVTALEIACNPEAERKEYLKKLAQLFNKAGDEALNVTRNDISELPPELHRLYKWSKDIKFAYDRALSLDPVDQKVAAIILAHLAMDTAFKFKTSLDLKEKVFLKRFIQKLGVTATDVNKKFQDNHYAAVRQRFKREFGI